MTLTPGIRRNVLPGAYYRHVTTAFRATPSDSITRQDTVFLQIGVHHRFDKYAPTADLQVAVEELERFHVSVVLVGVSFSTRLPRYVQGTWNV